MMCASGMIPDLTKGTDMNAQQQIRYLNRLINREVRHGRCEIVRGRRVRACNVPGTREAGVVAMLRAQVSRLSSEQRAIEGGLATCIEARRVQVRAELERRYAQEHVPVDTRIEHRDGRVEIVWFNGKQYTHDLDGYRWTVEVIGGRA